MGYLLIGGRIMKAKLYKIFSVLAVFFFCLTTFTASAYDLKADLTIYFDVTNFGDFSGKKLQIMIGHGSYSKAYEMKKVAGFDKIYSVNIGQVNNGGAWGGATQLGFMATSSVWGEENNSPQNRLPYADLKTKVYNIPKTLSGNVLFKITNTSNKSIGITENAVSYYITGIVGNNKIKMSYDANSNQYVLNKQTVKSTDVIKVRHEIGTYSIEYKTLEDGSCATSTNSGITMQDGIYDFYFKLSNNKLYIGANESNPTKYFIMGVEGDWDNGREITDENPKNADEVMLTCLNVTSNSEIKIKEKKLCQEVWKNAVKDGSVVSKPSGDNNISLPKGFYSFYYNTKDHNLFIGNATPTSCYLVGTEGGDKVMTLEDNQYELRNIQVKSTDKVKVKLVYDCGNIEYVTLDNASCSTVTSTANGITFSKDGYYDFYFKSDKTIYIGANTANPANADKYYLMGIDGDWDKADESNQLTQNPNNADELVLLGQKISQSDSKADAIKIVKKSLCAADEYYAEVKPSSTVIYKGGGTGVNPPNIVLEDGTYDFYFNKTNGKIHITGSVKNARVVYLDPKVENGSDWESDGARMAIYYFKSTDDNGWIGASYCDGYYYAYLPDGYDRYDWCRMNPDGENNWDSKWNQTSSITYSEAKPLTKLKEMNKNSYQTSYNGTCGMDYENLDCDFPILNPGDTLYVHINQFEDSDPCNYKFSSFEQAFTVLKNNSEICTSSTKLYGSLKEDEITLNVPVVMLVHYGPAFYRGTEKVGSSGGHINDAPAIFFRNINKDGVGHELIVRTADPKGNRAVLVHPVIRRSTNITLDNLDIVSDSELRDNAIDIDTGEGENNLEGLNKDFNIVPLSEKLHNITLKNSFFESYGRNCIHVVGINGIHVENNEFYTKYDFANNNNVDEAMDVVDWGGTIKFMNTQNVKFIRNNSEGTLATSFFIQGCQNVLLMNNVFWNDNEVAVPGIAESDRTVANVRLISYAVKPEDAQNFPLKNIGIYYNTFFIKENTSETLKDSYDRFDFFRIGGIDKLKVTSANMGNFDPTTIRFHYNNCYSFDTDIVGNNRYDTGKAASDPVNATKYYLQGIGEYIYKAEPTPEEQKIKENWCECFMYNNFWGEVDKLDEQSSSQFELGMFCTGNLETYNLFANVRENVCQTDPAEPGSLVVLGGGLNIGKGIEKDVSNQGADQMFNDRLNPDNGENSIRPKMAVDNSNTSLTPYDKIYKEPGTINLYTSPIVGSQTTDVMVYSLNLQAGQTVSLSLVNSEGVALDNSMPEYKLFGLTNKKGDNIHEIPVGEGGTLSYPEVYITFGRPSNVKDIKDVKTYKVFLKIVPSVDEYLILQIPIFGHYIPEITAVPGTWTVGAFQQRMAMPVDTIIWHGSASNEWDNRNNWYKTDGTLVTCLDALTEDLTVIIPNKESERYKTPPNGITKYPILPNISTDEDFEARGYKNRVYHGEQVNAGDNKTATKVANKIFMEYGSALVGVEQLGDRRYSEVEMEFTARRHDWLLVGPVVKPWDEGNPGTTRNVVSGDYYLNDLPHVYMHRAKAVLDEDGNIEASWNDSFTELDSVVTNDKAFAIRVPDQYGRNLDFFGIKTEKLPAIYYNEYFLNEGETPYDGNAPHTYTFTGRFYNEKSLPKYDISAYEARTPVILNNSYPANIDAQKLQEGLGTSLQYYDYEDKTFVALGEDLDKSIMTQHSFVIIPKAGLETLEIKREWFQTTETGHRSASVPTESFRVELRNEEASSASEIYVRYDALKGDEINYALDAPKIFNKMEASLPDLYAMRYNKKWAGLVIPTISEPIPLGINVSKAKQKFTFSLKRTSLLADVILEDRLTEKQYNLSAGETYEVEGLPVGVSEGRFYLMLQESPEEEPDDDVSTEVEDSQVSSQGIDIFTKESSVVVSSSEEVELVKVIISDVAGRHQVYNVSGQYIQLDLPVNTGVYTISVIGDKATRVEKIKLN